jgi:hypothetical protein
MAKLRLSPSVQPEFFEKSFTFEVKNPADKGSARYTIPVKNTMNMTSAENPIKDTKGVAQ